MRYAPAITQLIENVDSTRDAKVTANPYGDEDAYGVTRSVEFDVNTSKWLLPILEVLEDERLAEFEVNDKKRVVVTVVPTHLADFTHPFAVEAVDAVLNEPAAE